METGRWEEPVTFETGKLGQYKTISSTAEAAHILISQWPRANGRSYNKARETFLAVLEGRNEANAARAAFLKAAAEANVFIRG